MSANKDSKIALVGEIKDKISRAKSLVVMNYNGLTVEKDNELRNSFREENVEYRVYKNRLLLKALNELGIEGCEDLLQGSNGVAISYEDEVAGARIAQKFIKKNKVMQFVFGVMGDKVVDSKYVEAVAKLPGKPALIGQLLSVLNGPIRGVVVALNAIAEKSQEA